MGCPVSNLNFANPKDVDGRNQARPSPLMSVDHSLAPQDATERAAHDGAANGVAHRAANRLAEVAGDLASHPPDHRTCHVARDVLADRQTLAARAVGAEQRAELVAQRAEQAADPSVILVRITLRRGTAPGAGPRPRPV